MVRYYLRQLPQGLDFMSYLKEGMDWMIHRDESYRIVPQRGPGGVTVGGVVLRLTAG